LQPLLALQPEAPPWHSMPYQALPEVYVQNAALEIAWTQSLWRSHTISGTTIMPFLMPATESLDINDPADWSRAEQLAATGALPAVPQPPFSGAIS
jgi:CMP-N,N'-diacetyllegionaminic acid synthase